MAGNRLFAIVALAAAGMWLKKKMGPASAGPDGSKAVADSRGRGSVGGMATTGSHPGDSAGSGMPGGMPSGLSSGLDGGVDGGGRGRT